MGVESPQSDADLLHAVRAGDATAYRELQERHVAAARSLARQLVKGEAEAEDVVAESFTRILDLVGRGGGPEAGFRTYLLTVVRRTVYDRTRVRSRQVSPGDPRQFDPGVPFVDPALIGLERSLIAKAFLSLPERWRAVLWHTEVENSPPADVAPLLGLSPNGVTELTRRALAGLRQAYLQLHLTASQHQTCRPVLGSMSLYVRGRLVRRDSKAVDEHVSGCPACHAVLLELTDVNRGLRVIIGPLITGPVFAGYAAAMAKTRAAGARLDGPLGALGRIGWAPRCVLGWVRGESRQVFAWTRLASEQVLGWIGRLPGGVLGWVRRTSRCVLGRIGRVPRGVLGRIGRVSGGVLGPVGLVSRGVSGPIGRASRCVLGLVRRVPRYLQAAVAGGTAAAVAVAAAFTLVSADEPVRRLGAKPVASAGPPPLPPVDAPTRVPPERPAAARTATKPHGARLHATIGALGALVRDQPGIIGMRLRNSGNAPTGDLTATVDLPAGVTLIPSGGHGAAAGGTLVPSGGRGAASGGTLVPARGRDAAAGGTLIPLVGHGAAAGGTLIPSVGQDVVAGGAVIPLGGQGAAQVTPVGTVDGWTCRPVRQGAVCVRGPLKAGRNTAVFLRVQVAAQAPQGAGPAVRITSGDLRIGAHSTAGVRLAGAPARFATDGKVTVRAVGNSLLSCPVERDGCAEARQRQGDSRDDELWPMAALDEDGMPETYASSGATLRLPPGGRVVWAGLYWSASGENAGPIGLRPPGRRRYWSVRPEQVTVRDLPSGPAYQAFADVTGLVGSARRDGTWWAADPPMQEGAAQHAGWSLVVIATDPAEPYSHAVVLDTATVVGGEAGQVRIPLGGLVSAAAPTRNALGRRLSAPSPAETSLGGRIPASSPAETSLGGRIPASSPAETSLDGRLSPSSPARTSLSERASAPVRNSLGGRVSVPSPVRTSRGGRLSALARTSSRERASAAFPARIEMVTWEGDADLDGDRLSLGSEPLTPVGGDRDAGNVFDGSSNGAEGMTFGVDVDTFGAELGHDPALAIATRKDVVWLAIAAVSVRARS